MVAEDELPGRGRAIVIENVEPYGDGRSAIEENIRFVAEAEVLSSLPDVEGELASRLPESRL